MSTQDVNTIASRSNHGRQAPEMDPSLVCLAVVLDKTTLGFAAFREAENEILVEQCFTDSFQVEDTIERVLGILQPNLLLLPKNIVTNAPLLETLTTPASGGPPGSDHGSQGGLSIPYKLMKTYAFDESRGRTMIVQQLQVKSLRKERRAPASGTTRNFGSFRISNYHSIKSLIDLESKPLVQATGALLSFLLQAFQNASGTITVNRVAPINSQLYMNISTETMDALHIFATEYHPLMAAKGYGNSKEGFSLFTLLDRTAGQAGRKRLQEWMRKPLIDVDAIRERQDMVELFLQPGTQPFLSEMVVHLQKIASIDNIFQRLSKVASRTTDLIDLHRSLSASLSILAVLEKQLLWTLQGIDPADSPNIQRYIVGIQKLLSQCDAKTVQKVSDMIYLTIDESATIDYEIVVVKPGLDAELDGLKSRFASLQDILASIQHRLHSDLPHLRECMSCQYLPQFGFLISVKVALVEPDMLPEDFRFICVSGDDNLYKNTEMHGLDSTYGDIHCAIQAREQMIVRQLEAEVLDHESELRETMKGIAEIDCLQGVAVAADEYHWVRPTILEKERGLISIKNGRHPLQERVVESQFVPNDTHIDHDNRVNVITGPNFSGKSCYARQVGILVYMAHIGAFLPCENAEISIFESIIAHFGAVESCAVPQSSFQYDLSCLASIQNRASPFTLVIVDEFGKGTSPSSGIALLAAALNNFSRLRAKVVCTTHFLEIFSMNLVNDGTAGFRALRMAITIPSDSEEEDIDSPMPSFRLESGISTSSAGIACAKLAGLDKSIVDRASCIIRKTRKQTSVEPLVEAYQAAYGITPRRRKALFDFFATDWNKASEEDIETFSNLLG